MAIRYRILGALAALTLAVPGASAQETLPNRFELGLTYGAEHLSRTGPDVTARGLASLDGLGLYGSLFLNQNLFLATDFAAAVGDGADSFGFGSELAYLLRGARRPSPYLSLGLSGTVGGAESVEGGAEWGLGLGVGYRLPLGDRVSVRLGLDYRRWLHDRVDQLGVTFRVGFGFGGGR